MIRVLFNYKGELLCQFQAWAVPCVGDQLHYEEMMYTVTQRTFSYQGGMTIVACIIERL